MLVNGNLSRFHLGELFHGSYDDVNSDWYRDVGVSIMLTMTLNVINPHIMPVLEIPISAIRRIVSRRKMKTQRVSCCLRVQCFCFLNVLFSGFE